MRSFFIVSISCFLALATQAQHITGFGNKSEAQLTVEKQFDSRVSAASIGNMIKELSAYQHHLGSPGSKKVAETVLAWMKGWGLDAKIETYKVLFPTPKTRVLEMGSFKAALKEQVIKEDGTIGQADELPTYNAWSADGDVTAPLVFVNYGVPADYELLDRMGISVKGKIVIAKYGRSWRGIKPKVAQEHGAIGCLIYSDPADGGYRSGDVYPAGPFKHATGVQRGSVMDMPVYPGDPLTPGVGATQNAKRLERSAVTNLLKIPVQPISYADAVPLLTALGGPVAPAEWQGGLPITYHVGPGTQPVHLKLAFDWKMVDCHNVIGAIKGSTHPDQWVIRGNHHDAWTYGANDPISGLAALLEEARACGEMMKTGWRPHRTMIFCAWDGEEPGLLGSTEWVEDHEKELREKCVAYINSDGNGRGYLEAGGSHALEPLMDGIAKAVTDPQTGISVYQRRRAARFLQASSTAAKKAVLDQKMLKLDALGSGSDYSSFLQHLGVPTLNLGFGGEDDGGEYHTNFDTYRHYSMYKDPGFVYGKALSQVAGRAALRLAMAEQLPFDYARLHKTAEEYIKDLQATTEQLREAAKMEQQALADSFYIVTRNPVSPLLPPATPKTVPYLDFSPVLNALASLEEAVESVKRKLEAAPKAEAETNRINKLLYTAEQQLLNPAGLPRRSWYRHTLYAPGFYTGYGVKTLPGIREAIEQKEFEEAKQQTRALADAINRLAEHLKKV